jgi:hypothetical protein
MYIGLQVLSDFNEPWIISTDFQKMLAYQMPWKSVQWETSCYTKKDWEVGVAMIGVAYLISDIVLIKTNTRTPSVHTSDTVIFVYHKFFVTMVAIPGLTQYATEHTACIKIFYLINCLKHCISYTVVYTNDGVFIQQVGIVNKQFRLRRIVCVCQWCELVFVFQWLKMQILC